MQEEAARPHNTLNQPKASRNRLARVIGHVDLDYFYAQVEEVENPLIKGKPVLVCVFSGRTQDSGVVSTANYEAREFGIRSGMPIVVAKRKLEGSDAVLIPMLREKYEAVSERVMPLVREEVDIFEQTGIDEAFFDITNSSGGDFSAARTIAVKIKGSISLAEGLTSSIGLGQSKMVAKVASDSMKPDGLTVVAPESTAAFLNPLAVTKLYGVGPKTVQILDGLGVRTVSELAGISVNELQRKFGRKTAVYLHDAANGTDQEAVTANREATQHSRMITLKRNTSDPDEAFGELLPAMADLHRRLSSGGISFRTLTAIGITTDLSVKTKSKTFEKLISDQPTLNDQTRILLRELIGSVDKELRRVGVRVSTLSSTEDQTSLTEFYQGA